MQYKVNIACGKVFVESEDWINLDYTPSSPSVKRANLLKKIPLDEKSVDVVYSSHFFEHIPRPQVLSFLTECCRILNRDGTIRLVLPDFKKTVQSYLSMRESSQHEKADFLLTLIVDQCVRSSPGGELLSLYSKYKSQSERYSEVIDLISHATGSSNVSTSDSNMQSITSLPLPMKLNHLFDRISGRLEREWILLLTRALPSAFRSQNISYTAVGERHQWLWDYEQLKTVLEEAGFYDVTEVQYNYSKISNFPLQALDMDDKLMPRKGGLSIYIEARKK